MRRSIGLGLAVLATSLLACFACKKAAPPPAASRPGLFVIGIFQSVDSPTANEVRKGILKAFEEAGLRDGENVLVRIRIANRDLSEVQRIARDYVADRVDLIMPLSTQCLQAVLISGPSMPIVFGAVATPFLVGAGRSPDDHLPRVTGVVSTGPVRQSVAFIRLAFPRARRLGSLWTPSEVNSEYYMELAREAAAEYGFEMTAVPVSDARAIPQAAQVLVNRKVDVLFPISDNTINASFEVISRVAEESRVPLVGGFLRAADLGACAAVGFDFYDLGYRTGRLAVRVKNGESPARIPIQSMTDVKVRLNPDAAARQGLVFAKDLLGRAEKMLNASPPGVGRAAAGLGPK
ncbi:MAG TPA: ABC transporter substrate-binding protein [Terriglobales bacterium]|nr:ABC transporter substrate-binding protein [Terriglobales bacterium]